MSGSDIVLVKLYRYAVYTFSVWKIIYGNACNVTGKFPFHRADSGGSRTYSWLCCGCDNSYIVSVHIQCQASIYTLSLCRGHSWRGAASQAGDADSSRAPGLTSGLQGSVDVHRGALLLVPQWRYISSLYFTFLSHLFPLPCGAGSAVPARGFDSSVIMPFSLVCCGCDTSYIVSVHIQCQASIYTLSLCRGHSWRVRLAEQETLTPPGHLVSPLVCRGPWMSTVVLYCWCHSDGTSVLLYFTFDSEHRELSSCQVINIWSGVKEEVEQVIFRHLPYFLQSQKSIKF